MSSASCFASSYSSVQRSGPVIVSANMVSKRSYWGKPGTPQQGKKWIRRHRSCCMHFVVRQVCSFFIVMMINTCFRRDGCETDPCKIGLTHMSRKCTSCRNLRTRPNEQIVLKYTSLCCNSVSFKALWQKCFTGVMKVFGSPPAPFHPLTPLAIALDAHTGNWPEHRKLEPERLRI